MKFTEVFYKSEDGKYRVIYCRYDLGMKYKLQRRNGEFGCWKFMDAYENPLAALKAMKKAAKEW